LAVLLFRLDGVDDDEAEDVRKTLTEHAIGFYETPGGRWGISVAAIWLIDEAQLTRARALIDDYQAQRARRLQEEHARLKRDGSLESLRDRLMAHPVQSVVYVAIALVVLYFSIKPFFELGR
jgi:hypothetical protein